MDSFELSTDTFEPRERPRTNRRTPLQPPDDYTNLLEEIDTYPPADTIDESDASADSYGSLSAPRPVSAKPSRKRLPRQQSPARSKTKANVATSSPEVAEPVEEAENHVATAPFASVADDREPRRPGSSFSLPSMSVARIKSDGRVGIFIGVVLILIAAYMLLASISYIANISTDQSALVNSSLDMIKNRGTRIDNTTGWFGAALSHFLVYRWLGVGSFILIFYVGAVGLNLVKLCRFRFWQLTFKSLVSAIAVSLILGLVTYKSPSPAFWGGEHGYYINTLLIDNASLWSAVAVSVAMLTALILIFVKPLSYLCSHLGRIVKGVRDHFAQRHDAAVEAAHRTEMRQQAERAAELARLASTPSAMPQPRAQDRTPVAESVNAPSERLESDDPLPAPKPEPLDEIYTPLRPSERMTAPIQNVSRPDAEAVTDPVMTTVITPTETVDARSEEESPAQTAHDDEPLPSIMLEEIQTTSKSTDGTLIAPSGLSEEVAPALSSVTAPLALSLSPEPQSISLDALLPGATETDEAPVPPRDADPPLSITPPRPIELAPEQPEKELAIDSYDPRADLSHYRFPGLDLLREINDDSVPIDEEEQEANKERIINILRSYGVEISTISATIGPTITLYEIVPAPGVRISKIKRLGDDVALNLAAMGIRIIAPIPGKGTIGMEVPNKKARVVSMHYILASRAYRESKAELPMAIGITISNEVYVTDLAKMPHLLVAGATGMGKSVGLNTIIASLLYRKHPAELKFVMVDPKRVEFSLYKCIERHYLAKLPEEENAIITEPDNVVTTLNSLCLEMEQRYELLSTAGVRGIREYNDKFIARRLNPEKGHRFLPYIVVVIDEFADLILTVGRDVEQPISRLAAKARAIGIHVILATQRPSVNVITGVIKANFPGRMAFRVTQRNDSQTILDRPGAEQLIGRGDMLISRNGIIDRVQCAFIDTPEVENICNFIAGQQAYPSAYELPEAATGIDGASAGGALTDRDPLFPEAGREVIAQGVGSTSSLQRKFNIGYPRAGKIMDQLEIAGVVGPAQGAKPRAVLMDMYSFERYLES